MQEPAAPPPAAPPPAPRIHKILFWVAVAAWPVFYLLRMLFQELLTTVLVGAGWNFLVALVVVGYVMILLSAIPASVAALYPLFRRDLSSNRWVVVAWVTSIPAALFFDATFCVGTVKLVPWIAILL